MIDTNVSTKHLRMFTLPTETKRKLVMGLMGMLKPAENERCKKYFYKNFADDGLERLGTMNQVAYLLERQKGECEAIDGNTSNPDYDKYIMKKLHRDAQLA